MSEKNNKATKKRTAEDKKAVLEQLAKLPIVQVACQKAGICRATYYRWRIEDKQFIEDADEAIEEGVQMINDLSESQLIAAIKNQNFSAVRFWLQNRHRAYTNKVEVFDQGKRETQELTDEQKKIVEEALRLASVNPEKNDTAKSRTDHSTTD